MPLLHNVLLQQLVSGEAHTSSIGCADDWQRLSNGGSICMGSREEANAQLYQYTLPLPGLQECLGQVARCDKAFGGAAREGDRATELLWVVAVVSPSCNFCINVMAVVIGAASHARAVSCFFGACIWLQPFVSTLP